MSAAWRVGVYDLYWDTLGGGEQVDGSIAQVLAAAGHEVTVLGPTQPDVERTRERLGVDLSACRYERVVDDAEASEASERFDVFVNGTYLSRAVNRAPIGYYYVHFPQVPPRRRDRARSKASIAAVKGLRSLPVDELPQRLREVQAGFDRRIDHIEFIGSYTRFLANSGFTAGWVERLWGRTATVLYPPVRPLVGAPQRSRTIVSVGRFFDPRHGHSKKQRELLEAFVELERSGAAPGWRLVLVGGCDAANREYFLDVKRAAQGHDVDLHVNARGSVVSAALSEASIYWHGSGFGEDPERHPERFEHFGISVVEAMAAGAVPVVFGAAGPAEIVRDGIDGRHWHDLGQLVDVTASLVADPGELARCAASSVDRAAAFGVDRFAERLVARLEEDCTP